MALTDIDAGRLADNVFNVTGANKNRIINGDMRIDQRNAGAAITSNSGFPVDRWITYYAGGGVYSGQRSTTAPAGFVNSLLLTVTTADSSIAATDNYLIRHNVEGFNVDDLAWGTASAKTVTLSFWVRSSVTGTYGGSLTNHAENRSYPFSYTISAADTFEYKTITIPGETTGTWLTNNSRGVAVHFALGMGSTYSGTAGAWASALYWSSTGATNWIATNGATFYITGVQLEVGSVATPFEHRSYDDELARCQRYCQRFTKIHASGTVANSTETWHPYTFPVAFRASPTLTVNALGNVVKEGTNWYPNTAISLNDESQFNTVIKCTQSNNNMVATNSTRLGQGCDLTFSAEF